MSYKVIKRFLRQHVSQRVSQHADQPVVLTHRVLLAHKAMLAGLALTFGCFQAAQAAEQPTIKSLLWTDQEISAQRQLEANANPAVELRRSYGLGVNRYALNHATRLIGWQVGQKLYFGRAKGEDSSIALVWQRRWNQQVSLSNDGIRLTRHF